MNRIYKKPIYILVPGYIKSKYDGDFHYISAEMLQHLYNVDPACCIKKPTGNELIGWKPPKGAVFLQPRYDGNYSL